MTEKILVATDGSDHGRKAVETAAELAGKYDATLKIVHVMMHGEPPSAFRRMAQVEHLVHEPAHAHLDVKEIPGGVAAIFDNVDEKRLDHEVIEVMARRVLDYAVEAAKAKGATKIESEALEGDPANRILKAAEAAGADLIVIGSRGFGPIKGLLMGSVSQKVTQLAPCSCMTVR